jgi:hypothetical protein
MKFCDIEFGKADAGNEKSESPYLLIDGFFDLNNNYKNIINGKKFLVLGPKGSGKTAIGARIDLMKDDNSIVKQYYLGSFPYKPFSGVLPGREAPETKLPVHWEFILLIGLLDSLSKDKYCDCNNDENFLLLVDTLKNSGLLPSDDLSKIITVTTQKQFLAGIQGLLSGQASSQKVTIPLDNNMLFRTIQESCYNAHTNSKHYIIIDGLDDVLTHRENQYDSLYALIIAADRMNKHFSENKISVKIIVLCRKDVFEKLSGPNTTNIKSDSALILDWYQTTNDYRSTNLIKMVNLRAKVSLKRDKEVDIFREFLPDTIPHGRNTLKLIIELTRHRPRDIIQLLNHIQSHNRDRNPNDNPSINDVMDAIRTYSYEHFLSEVRNELYGFISKEQIELTIKLLGLMKVSTFTVSDLEKMKNSDPQFKSLELEQILEVLFNCSAIGNETDGYFTFKYRNPNNSFNRRENIVIHKGLKKALNLA